MTLTQMLSLVWEWLDDSDGIRTGTGGYFGNATVTRWLNLATYEVQKLLIEAGENWYIRCQTTNTIVSQREYQLPSDFLKSHRLELTTSGTGTDRTVIPLKPISLNQQDRIGKGVGLPRFYILKKNTFELYPAPDASYPIELYYSYRPVEMATGSDTPDCPDEYQELIAILAAYNGFMKDDRVPNILEMKKQQYIDLLKKAAEDRQEDAPRHVIETDIDDGGVFLF